ncbi:MAG: MotA/TolQ/ExbB proton channel family protein [Thermoplasmata archaeon]|nr:MotA/TolQ/ExbB proton channel family protein [Thermoplasmata archaeon]
MDFQEELMRILLAISNALLYPVLILLIILVAVTFLFIGELLAEYANRKKRSTDEIDEDVKKIKNGRNPLSGPENNHLSIFYGQIARLMSEDNINKKILTTKIERLLQDREREIAKRLEKTRILIKIGPMLGLMGTLIPLGPALIGLSEGKLEELSSNLMIAFTSTVVGLLIGGVSMVITSIRRRWYRQDMDDMEYAAEILVEMIEGEEVEEKAKGKSAKGENDKLEKEDEEEKAKDEEERAKDEEEERAKDEEERAKDKEEERAKDEEERAKDEEEKLERGEKREKHDNEKQRLEMKKR